jgi:hypothetical protein
VRQLRTKTTTISVRSLFAGNGCLQDVLAAGNPDGVVIDLDGSDDRMYPCVQVHAEPQEAQTLFAKRPNSIGARGLSRLDHKNN